MVENEDKAEIMILELMREYSFNLSRLKDLLRQNHLEVSLSKVQYADIAPIVGLEAVVKGDDILAFDMFRARLPNSVFNQIVEDLRRFSAQYGPMSKHENEEARACYLSGYFNRIIALFSGLLFNTPETILEGGATTKDRIEYQFKTFGGITVVFIQAKLDIGSLQERITCLAQVIAECGACAWMNYQNGFHVPIMAIWCDGKQFCFFKFIDRHLEHVNPQFFWGKFANGDRKLSIDEIELRPGTDSRTFVRQTRQICESLYYVFLFEYQSGLEAYWKRGVEKRKAHGIEREPTPEWPMATVHAKAALDEALSAWNQINRGNLTESKISAERAVQLLAERYIESCHSSL
ncbi:uncharacterized protein Z518_01905 [Rhinocladiella mackenziei CBS 650.93]|uniref:Uncharacterized protein n=1 Tax=Rhinocladiella mackenziei CBS 650.93 TaxID=1442369 RepID=A0A0D2FY75_9EURO|nr:uncharacterized protein Z518_01905 [Rhinocladiella mackenziei CBS 650.93]KIX07252.1 hypothetical protein Z518_01905 [Rhinocladiella mackenziei CBS 650.93]